MMIMDSLADSCELAQEIAAAKFKSKSTTVVPKQVFKDLVRSTHLSGKTNVAEVILRTHKTNPYTSIDDIMGDLQIILMKSWNELKMVNPNPEMSNLTLEELVNELPEECRQN